MNALKTIGLMVGLTLILVWAEAAFGGRSGMTMALIFALMMNVFTYWFTGRGITKLFSTHPPMEERIARLENMGP